MREKTISVDIKMQCEGLDRHLIEDLRDSLMGHEGRSFGEYGRNKKFASTYFKILDIEKSAGRT